MCVRSVPLECDNTRPSAQHSGAQSLLGVLVMTVYSVYRPSFLVWPSSTYTRMYRRTYTHQTPSSGNANVTSFLILVFRPQLDFLHLAGLHRKTSPGISLLSTSWAICKYPQYYVIISFQFLLSLYIANVYSMLTIPNQLHGKEQVAYHCDLHFRHCRCCYKSEISSSWFGPSLSETSHFTLW